MARLGVEVVYATAAGVDAVRVSLPAGATLRDAVLASGIPARHPGLDLASAALGVFGAARDPGTRAAQGDRIEIYRPLEVQPGEARRRRARRVSRTSR